MLHAMLRAVTTASGLVIIGPTSIAGGYAHSLALKEDGTVVGWGWDYYGQATAPSGLTDVVQVAAGGYHSLAVKDDGTVVAWGGNGYGQSTVPSGLVAYVPA